MNINTGDRLLIGQSLYKVCGMVNGSYQLQDVMDYVSCEIGTTDSSLHKSGMQFPVVIKYTGEPVMVNCGKPHGMSKYSLETGNTIILEVTVCCGEVSYYIKLADGSMLGIPNFTEQDLCDYFTLVTPEVYLEDMSSSEIANVPPLTSIQSILEAVRSVTNYTRASFRIVTGPSLDISTCRPDLHHIVYGSKLYTIRDIHNHILVVENVETCERKGFVYDEYPVNTLKPVCVRYTGADSVMPAWYNENLKRDYPVNNTTPLILMDCGCSFSVCTVNREWLCDVDSELFQQFEILANAFTVYDTVSHETVQNFNSLNEALEYRKAIHCGAFAEWSPKHKYVIQPV